MNDFLDFQPFTDDDLQPPSGPDIPKGSYTTALHSCVVDEKDTGTQLVFRWHEYLTADGADEAVDAGTGTTVRLHNRTMFQREWVTQNSAEAQRIGRQRLTQVAKAIGIAEEVTTPEGKTAHKLPAASSPAELGEMFAAFAGTRVSQYITKKKRSDTGDIESAVGSNTAL
jgi:hypothetical protein